MAFPFNSSVGALQHVLETDGCRAEVLDVEEYRRIFSFCYLKLQL